MKSKLFKKKFGDFNIDNLYKVQNYIYASKEFFDTLEDLIKYKNNNINYDDKIFINLLLQAYNNMREDLKID